MNPFENALKQLQKAINLMNIDEDVSEFLKYPMREITVSIPVKMDNGKNKIFTGFRILYSNILGPGKGGVRYHPLETIDTVRALSLWMTIKTSLLDLHLGGGKGGIICDPHKMSEGELERLTRGYIRAIYPFIGSNIDGLAPDVNTDSKTMSIMLNEFKILTNSYDIGVVTGKPIILGGSEGRSDATAKGGMYVLKSAIKKLNIKNDFTVAIMGYGEVGMNTHKIIEYMFPEAKVIALSNIHGGVYNIDGLKYSKIKNPETFANKPMFNESNYISNVELLEIPCDVLIPAALEGVITKDNVENIKASTILELANGPTSSKADDVLYQKGIHVIPDILANSGGVSVSAMEQQQNIMNYYWSAEEIYSKLDIKISKVYNDVLKVSKEMNINMRTAAYILALNRIVEGIKIQNLV